MTIGTSTLSVAGALALALTLIAGPSVASTLGSDGLQGKAVTASGIQLAQKAPAKAKPKTVKKSKAAPKKAVKAKAAKKKKKKKVAAKKSACQGLSQSVCTASKACGWIKPKAKSSKSKKKFRPYCRTVAKAKPKAKKSKTKASVKKKAKKVAKKPSKKATKKIAKKKTN